jgi:hypothetical protein
MSTYANFLCYYNHLNAFLVNAGSTGTRHLVPSWSAGILACLYDTQINSGAYVDSCKHRPGLCLRYPGTYEGDIVTMPYVWDLFRSFCLYR